MASAQPQRGVKVGTLTCNVSSGFGFIFGSKKSLKCTYARTGGTGEHYSGTFSKYGLDIGFADSARAGLGRGGADLRRAAGGDAAGRLCRRDGRRHDRRRARRQRPVGGLDKSIALQPLSISGNTGLNLAAGVGVITLKYEP